jgi:hypothetical protein
MRVLKLLIVSPGFLVPLLPLAGVGFLGYWVMRMRREGAAGDKCSYYVLTSAVLAGLLVSVVIVRADIIHFMYLAPLWYVLLAWILGSRHLAGHKLWVWRPYLMAYVTIAFGLMAMAVLLTATGAQNRIETRCGIITTGNRDTGLEYVLVHTKPGDELLVYPYLPLYNYLTATRSPSRYDYFQPGMNTEEQALEIIAIMQSKKMSAVLFEPWFADKFANSWPGTPINEVGRDSVADYIVRNYRVCKILNSASQWRFEYMVRKEEPCS